MTDMASLLSSYEIVDLSLPFGEEFPTVFPGHPRFEHKVQSWYEPIDGPPQKISSFGPYFDNWMLLDEHSGTHFDAPTHFIPPPDSGLPHAAAIGGVYGADVPLSQLQGPAAVIDCRPLLTDELGKSRASRSTTSAPGRPSTATFRPVTSSSSRADGTSASCPGRRATRTPTDPSSVVRPPGPLPTRRPCSTPTPRACVSWGTDAPTIGAADETMSTHYAGLENNLLFVESLATSTACRRAVRTSSSCRSRCCARPAARVAPSPTRRADGGCQASCAPSAVISCGETPPRAAAVVTRRSLDAPDR